MLATPRSDLIIGHQTHAGETGKNNEDRAFIQSYQGLSGENGDMTLAVIADGIGGHRAGEVASQIAVNTFKSIFDQANSRAYLDLFTQAFASIQQALTRHIATNPESEGMGTTCSAVVIANRRLYLAFIGDSRIYLMRDGTIRQISVDHTWVQEAIEHGILTRQDARKHPNRHVVRRHLGAGQDSAPDFRLHLDDSQNPEEARRNQGLPLKTGDTILITSDGLTDLVDDHEILANFEGKTPQQAVDALVLMARQRGGYDNITVTALQIPAGAGPVAAVPGRARKLAPALLGGTMLVGLIIGFLALILLGLGTFLLIRNNPFVSTSTPVPNIVLSTATPQPTFTLTPIKAIIQPDTPTVLPPTATRTPRPTLLAPTSVPSSTPTSAGAVTSAATDDLTSVWVTLTALAVIRSATP
jgi:PPM family protein phosphatase